LRGVQETPGDLCSTVAHATRNRVSAQHGVICNRMTPEPREGAPLAVGMTAQTPLNSSYGYNSMAGQLQGHVGKYAGGGCLTARQ
jgi:hypothetical protein